MRTQTKLAAVVAFALAAGLGTAGVDAQEVPKAKAPPKAAVKAPPKAKPPAEKAPVLPTTTVAGVKVGLTCTPADAVVAAEADCQTLKGEAPFYRYIWIEDGSLETMKAMALVVNYPSHATTVVRPTPVIAGNVLLLRVDLRAYAPQLGQLEQFLKLWEDYQYDPKFSVLITKDVLGNLTYPDDKVPVVRVKKTIQKKAETAAPGEPQWRTETRVIPHPGGRFKIPDDTDRYYDNLPAGNYSFELKFKAKADPVAEFVEVREFAEVKLTDVKDVNLVRLAGYHLPVRQYADLVNRMRTAAPVVSHSYWMCRHLSTVKDDGVYAELYGGRYYDFMLFKRDQKKGTDEDHILEGLGLGNVEAGETAEKLFDRLRSDQRVAMFKSKVTGKPRRADFLRSPTGRDGTGIVAITHDLRDKDIDVGQHPILNLLKFKDAAREGIFEQKNGLHGFWLTDGAGKLQDEAPPDVVADYMIPTPHSRRLQGAVSCIRCHGVGRDDGWKPATNDVKKLVAKYNDIFGDVTKKNDAVPDTLDRLAGLYQGDPENRLLPRGRDDYAAAVLKATGPWPASKDQVDVVSLAAARIAKVWEDRNYTQVGPKQALLEMGIVCEEKDAETVLRAVLLPAVENAALGIVPEDPRIGALKAGIPINRVDWDLTYGFAAPRAQRTLMTLQGAKK